MDMKILAEVSVVFLGATYEKETLAVIKVEDEALLTLAMERDVR